jgi:hypothetical protein
MLVGFQSLGLGLVHLQGTQNQERLLVCRAGFISSKTIGFSFE